MISSSILLTSGTFFDRNNGRKALGLFLAILSWTLSSIVSAVGTARVTYDWQALAGVVVGVFACPRGRLDEERQKGLHRVQVQEVNTCRTMDKTQVQVIKTGHM